MVMTAAMHMTLVAVRGMRAVSVTGVVTVGVAGGLPVSVMMMFAHELVPSRRATGRHDGALPRERRQRR
jgi:hypothetical protein